AQRDEVLPGAVSRVPPLYVRLAGLEFDFAAIRPGGTLFTFRSQGPSWTLGTHLTSLTLGAFGPLRSLGSLWAGDVGEGHQVMPSGLGDLAPLDVRAVVAELHLRAVEARDLPERLLRARERELRHPAHEPPPTGCHVSPSVQRSSPVSSAKNVLCTGTL